MGHEIANTGYRGRERRRESDDGSGVRAWRYVGATLVVASLVLIGMLRAGQIVVDASQVVPALRTAACVLAVVVAGTAWAYWRATGRAHGLHVAVVACLLAVQVGVELAVGGGRATRTPVVALALGVTAAGWMWRAVMGAEVNSRLRLGTQLLQGAAVALGVGALTTWTGVASATPGLTSLSLGIAWLGVGAAGLVRAVARGWNLLGWMSWAVIAMGIGEAGSGIFADGGAGQLVRAVMAGSGLLIAAVGGGVALAAVAIARRGDVHALAIEARHQEAQADDQRREFAHDVRNAVLVVEGAASMLERLADHLSRDERARVEQALRSGLANLRSLVTDTVDASHEVFPLDELVQERAAAAEMRGVTVAVSALEPVEVVGRQVLTGRAIDNLLLNAERHGGAGSDDAPVRVTVASVHAMALVRVEDDGPGIAAEPRELVFESGYQTDPNGQGQGIGLHVARNLVRAQHGDIVCQDRPGGGACFVLSLPLASRVLDPVGGPATQERHDGR